MVKSALKFLLCSALVAVSMTSCKEDLGYKDLVAPPQISNIQVQSQDSKLTISWIDPEVDDLSKIKFVYYDLEENDGSYLTAYADAGEQSVTLNGLLNDYEYFIRAYSYDIHGNASAPVVISATPAPVYLNTSELPIITNVSVKNSDKKAIITWVEPASTKIHHIRFDWLKDDGSVGTQDINTGVRQFILDNLVNEKRYDIKAFSVNAAGELSRPTNIFAYPTSNVSTSGAPAGISNINVQNLDRKVKITWTDPADADLEKIRFVYYDWENNNGSFLSKEVNAGIGEVLIEDLVNDFGYDIKAYSINSSGNSSKAVNIAAVPTIYNGGFVLAYFKSNGGEGDAADAKNRNSLFLAYSEDGLNYTACNNNNAVLKIDNRIGSGTGLIRDPFMTRCGDKFIMVATDWTTFQGTAVPEYGTNGTDNYWGVDSQSLIFAESKDMVNWSNQHCVRMVDSSYSNVRSVWAPQVIYDPDYVDVDNQLGKGAGNKGAFMVFWTGAGVEDPQSTDYTRRTWANWTHDFVTFTRAKMIYEYEYQGQIVTEIDADIVPVNGKYFMDYKGESNDAKDIQMGVAPTAHGPYTVLHDDKFISRTNNQSKANGIEGSFIINSNDGKWWMFGDHYGDASTTATTNFWGWSSSEGIDAAPELWVQHANDGQYKMPGGCRHGYATRITKEELETLKNAKTFTAIVASELP